MRGGHGDQNSEKKHLKNVLGCNTKKSKKSEWFWPATEGMAFLTWKIKIKTEI